MPLESKLLLAPTKTENSVAYVIPISSRDYHLYSLRATAVPAGTAEARISYGNSVCPSVCLSVCHDPVVYQAQMR